MGKYGVTGFLIVDTRPEERYESYTDSNLYGVSHSIEHCQHIPPEVRGDPLQLSHFIETDKGFKMIRYFIIPENARGVFGRDKHLGPALIKKCLEDCGIPEWFNDEEAYEVFTYDKDYISGEVEGEKLVGKVKENIIERLRSIGETLSEYRGGHHAYVSFHPWQYYKDAIGVEESSIVTAIANFDRALSMLDKKGTLQKRNLQTESESRIALPPAY